MQAGALRHQVQIQSTSDSTDAGGGHTASWSTITDGTVWASIQPIKGMERFQALQLQQRVTHRIVIRYLTGVETGHRVLFGSRAFDIMEVLDPEERGISLQLMCEERKAS